MYMSVIGCGYLGAVHAAAMAHLGHEVIGVETDEGKANALARGSAFFYEPDFDEILQEQMTSGRLRFTSDIREVAEADLHFVAVGTPQSLGHTRADLSYLHQAVDSLTRIIPAASDAVVVGKSTVPVGTAAKLSAKLARRDTPLIWNPEFLRESHAVHDTLHPDRIVYGLPEDPDQADYARNLLDKAYHDLLDEGIERIVTDYATAELVKVAANAFLATKISFINGMAELCEATGADVTVLADAIGKDARIGRAFLGSGLGFGGGCLPKDIRALQARADSLGLASAVSFLTEVDAINQRRRTRVVDLVVQKLGREELSGAKIAFLGAAFKPNSDDIRDSPSLDVARRLHQLEAQVCITDPKALDNVRRVYPELSCCDQLEQAVKDADIIVLGTEWPEFTSLDPHYLAGFVKHPVIIDGRNALDPKTWTAAGWNYQGLGR